MTVARFAYGTKNVGQFPDAWITRRIAIARHWTANHPSEICRGRLVTCDIDRPLPIQKGASADRLRLL